MPNFPLDPGSTGLWIADFEVESAADQLARRAAREENTALQGVSCFFIFPVTATPFLFFPSYPGLSLSIDLDLPRSTSSFPFTFQRVHRRETATGRTLMGQTLLVFLLPSFPNRV